MAWVQLRSVPSRELGPNEKRGGWYFTFSTAYRKTWAILGGVG